MVYGTCNYSIHGAYRPTYNWGAHIVWIVVYKPCLGPNSSRCFFSEKQVFFGVLCPHVSPKTSSSTASFGCFEPVARSTSPNVSRGTGGTVSPSSRSPGRSPLALALAFCPTDPTGSSEKGHFESGSMKIYNSLTWNSVILCYIEIIHDNSLYTDHHLLGGCSEVVLIYPE